MSNEQEDYEEENKTLRLYIDCLQKHYRLTSVELDEIVSNEEMILED